MSLFVSIYGTRAYLSHVRGQFDKALRLYEKMFSKDHTQLRPQDFASYTSLLLRKGEYQKAYETIKEGIEICKVNPKRRMSILSLTSQYVITLWKLGRLDEALSEQEQVHANMPSANSYGTLGYFYLLKGMETGDYEKSLSFNLEAVEYADDDPTILDNLAQTYYRLGEYENAKKYFELALEEKPTQVDSLLYLAKTYEAMGDLNAALEWAKKAAAQQASHLSAVTDEMTHGYLAEISEKTK